MKTVYTFAEGVKDAFHQRQFRCAFTLAEVLITLSIIGIAAALTIPSLIHKHRISVVETSLKNFYSKINEAIKLSEIDNGSKLNWEYTYPDTEEWFNKYFKPYLRTAKKSETKVIQDAGSDNMRPWFYVYFADGTAARIWSNNSIQYCLKEKYFEDINNSLENCRCFTFGFYPAKESFKDYYYKKGIEPYVNAGVINGTVDIKAYPDFYAKRIQLNGWKVPDDLKDNVR